MRLARIAVTVVLLVCMPVCADIVGVAHVHTTFSDGWAKMAEAVRWAVKLGSRFVILSDHAEMFNKVVKELGQPEKRCGVQNFLDDFKRVKEDFAREGVTVIPGLEVGGGGKRHNHLLIMGGSTDVYWRIVKEADDLGENADDERTREAFERIARLVHGAGGIVIAAHPTVDNFIGVMEYPFTLTFYGLDGLEMFNHGAKDTPDDVAKLWQNLPTSMNPLTLTAGADYHNSPGDNDLAIASGGGGLWPVLKRHIIVRTDNPGEIISSIKSCNNYVAMGDIRIRSTNLPIGNKIPINQPLHLTVDGFGFLGDCPVRTYFISQSGERLKFLDQHLPGDRVEINMDLEKTFKGQAGRALLMISNRFAIGFVVTPAYDGKQLAQAPGSSHRDIYIRPADSSSSDPQPLPAPTPAPQPQPKPTPPPQARSQSGPQPGPGMWIGRTVQWGTNFLSIFDRRNMILYVDAGGRRTTTTLAGLNPDQVGECNFSFRPPLQFVIQVPDRGDGSREVVHSGGSADICSPADFETGARFYKLTFEAFEDTGLAPAGFGALGPLMIDMKPWRR